jgi:hypothetical protein
MPALGSEALSEGVEPLISVLTAIRLLLTFLTKVSALCVTVT